MSFTRLYLEPTEDLMSQEIKNRLAHNENLPTHQLHGSITLREHMPSKN